MTSLAMGGLHSRFRRSRVSPDQDTPLHSSQTTTSPHHTHDEESDYPRKDFLKESLHILGGLFSRLGVSSHHSATTSTTQPVAVSQSQHSHGHPSTYTQRGRTANRSHSRRLNGHNYETYGSTSITRTTSHDQPTTTTAPYGGYVQALPSQSQKTSISSSQSSDNRTAYASSNDSSISSATNDGSGVYTSYTHTASHQGNPTYNPTPITNPNPTLNISNHQHNSNQLTQVNQGTTNTYTNTSTTNSNINANNNIHAHVNAHVHQTNTNIHRNSPIPLDPTATTTNPTPITSNNSTPQPPQAQSQAGQVQGTNQTQTPLRHRSRSPALPLTRPKSNLHLAYASNDILDPKEEELTIANAEIMYAKATWRMYERITNARKQQLMERRRLVHVDANGGVGGGTNGTGNGTKNGSSTCGWGQQRFHVPNTNVHPINDDYSSNTCTTNGYSHAHGHTQGPSHGQGAVGGMNVVPQNGNAYGRMMQATNVPNHESLDMYHPEADALFEMDHD